MSRKLPFTKMHGAGNDVVIVDCSEGDPVEDWTPLARRLLDRRLGVGGDQLLLVQPSSIADAFMGIRNPDGSTAQMCANGVRAFFKYLRDRGRIAGDTARIETLAGVVTPRWVGDDMVEVQMTPPVLAPAKIPTRLPGAGPLIDVPLQVGDQTLRVSAVSMGNPHCVIFVDDPDKVPVETLGPQIENHEMFPERTNVEFVAVRSRGEIWQRTWERGTGETLACGSGACATAVAAILSGRADREVDIVLRGGTLRIRWPDDQATVWMTGPATHVYEGAFAL